MLNRVKIPSDSFVLLVSCERDNLKICWPALILSRLQQDHVEMICTPLSPLFCIIDRGGSLTSVLNQE
jgi:hypothetical protein